MDIYLREFNLKEWPSDALLAVATHFLKDVDLTDVERSTAIQMCQEYHTDVAKLSVEYNIRLKRHNYVTPTSYLELINLFKKLLNTKRAYVDFSLQCQ